MLCFDAAATRYKKPRSRGVFYVRLKIYFKI